MSIQAKCIDKYRDRKGSILGYLLVDSTGNQVEVKSDTLKNSIRSGEVVVENLKLTSDNRLIDQMCEDEANEKIKIHMDDIIYLINKNKQLAQPGCIHYWSDADINTLIYLFNTLCIDVYKIKGRVFDNYTYTLSCGRYLISCNNHGIGIHGKVTGKYQEYTTWCDNKERIQSLIKILRTETSNSVKNLGFIIDKIVNTYKYIAKKYKIDPITIDVTLKDYNKTTVNFYRYIEHKSLTISNLAIKIDKDGEYFISYSDDIGEYRDTDVNEWYTNTEALIQEMEERFKRTIAEVTSSRKFNLMKLFSR